MSTIKDFIFLLGGYDLEMLEIRDLLAGYKNFPDPEFQIDYLDLGLHWGARLSSYSDKIPELNAKKIVGIELIEDFPEFPNYTGIDHHGKNADLPSSIEQVARLLNLALSRYQILVAINDRSYIPGLLDYGATREEIADIRRKDREAQGVTIHDEQLAEQSISDHLTIENGITIIKSLTSRFSAITDRLYPYSKLLVYTDHEMTYYGENAHGLSLEYNGMIEERKAYSGGGENGFFGIACDGLALKELLHLKDEIISGLAKKR